MRLSKSYTCMARIPLKSYVLLFGWLHGLPLYCYSGGCMDYLSWHYVNIHSTANPIALPWIVRNGRRQAPSASQRCRFAALRPRARRGILRPPSACACPLAAVMGAQVGVSDLPRHPADFVVFDARPIRAGRDQRAAGACIQRRNRKAEARRQIGWQRLPATVGGAATDR